MLQNNTTRKRYKLKNDPLFNTDPDKVIKDYVLPNDKQSLVEVLNPNYMALKIYRLPRTGNISKCYHYQKSGKLIKSLGNVNEISYAEACHKARQEIAKLNKTAKTSITSFTEMFNIFCASNHIISKSTFKKWNKIFKSKFQKLCDKDVRKLTTSDFLPIFDRLYNEKKYATLSQSFYLAKHILELALAREVLVRNPLCYPISELYNIPKPVEYPYINSDEDLKALIEFCTSYKQNQSVRNGLTLALLTGLFSADIRNMTSNSLQKDEFGEYYLRALRYNKSLGIPKEVGDWLTKIINHNSGNKLLFPNASSKALSDATLSKALEGYKPSNGQEYFVVQSFKKILGTFCFEEMTINGFSESVIERTLLLHKQTYENDDLGNTRAVLTWWLKYLKNLGLKL